jgi:two-component system cell cycle sensor histidine kinase PleC
MGTTATAVRDGDERRAGAAEPSARPNAASPGRIADHSFPRSATSNRNDVGRSVREARDRLTSSTGTSPAYDYELIRLFVDNRSGATAAIVPMIMLTGGTSALFLPWMPALGWTVAMLALHALTTLLCARFRRESAEPGVLARYRALFATLDFIAAIGWVVLLAGLVASHGVGAREFALLAALVYIAGMAMLSAPIPGVVYAGTLPVILVACGFYLAQNSITDFALAALMLEASACFLIVSRRLNGIALGALEARGEKDALIGELEQAVAKSDDALLRAEAASLAKSRFLAQMSHELRTPLNAILGFSEVMKSEILGAHANPTYREYAGDIHSSGQHLLNLINEILDLSRIEAGRYELNEEAVPLASVVEDCRHLLKIRAKTRGIAIHELYEAELPRLWADERALRQICLNLLSNAIKFTPQGGEIWLKVGWTYSGGQYLSVRDTGPGIPEHEIPIVMASFGQGSNAIKTAEQGAGLGLPIVKGLIDLHGGTFQLKSRLREGTEVIVTFPSERVMAALPPVPDSMPLAPEGAGEEEDRLSEMDRPKRRAFLTRRGW